MNRPGDGSGTTARGCAYALLLALILAAGLWPAVRAGGYGELYRRVAGALDAYGAPQWLAVVLAAAALVGLWLVLSGRRSTRDRPPSPAPDVHLRAEPRGHITLVIAEGRGAAAADIVVPRNPAAERDIIQRLRSLASREASFADTGVGVGETARELGALGRALAERILGGESAAGRIGDLSGDHLQLRVHAELASLPWEQLVPRRGGLPLWRLFHVGRQLRLPGAAPTTPRRPGLPLRVLLIAGGETDTGTDLPSAELEADAVLELAGRRPELLRVVRKSPRTLEELSTLLYGDFGVLHFAGHAVESPEGRVWVLPGGESFRMRDLPPSAPPLVFANACATSGSPSRPDVDATAHDILSRGAAAYVGTLWNVADAGAAAFAGAFYSALTNGSTLGAALTTAREAVHPQHPLTAAGYVLYGDPTAVLARVQDTAKNPDA